MKLVNVLLHEGLAVAYRLTSVLAILSIACYHELLTISLEL